MHRLEDSNPLRCLLAPRTGRNPTVTAPPGRVPMGPPPEPPGAPDGGPKVPGSPVRHPVLYHLVVWSWALGPGALKPKGPKP